jgi:hypothetical protein
MAILNQAQSGIPVPELCCEHGMNSATFYMFWSTPTGPIILNPDRVQKKAT